MNNRIGTKRDVRQLVRGVGFICLAAAFACLLATSAGEAVTHLVGKAAWYLPYVSLVLAVRSLRVA